LPSIIKGLEREARDPIAPIWWLPRHLLRGWDPS